MATYFVSQGRDEIPRWREAFSEARLIAPAQARAWVARGDCVWVMADVEAWPGLVEVLRRSGAALAVMSYAPTPREAFQALDAGARAYVHALSPPEVLRQAALVITHQGIWVPPELMARVVGGAFRALGGAERLREETLRLLTERERSVALAVVEGLSNKEVARRLGITERTVKAHLGAIFRKLGVRDRMQLILRLSQREPQALETGR